MQNIPNPMDISTHIYTFRSYPIFEIAQNLSQNVLPKQIKAKEDINILKKTVPR
jgi:hypothetical protein